MRGLMAWRGYLYVRCPRVRALGSNEDGEELSTGIWIESDTSGLMELEIRVEEVYVVPYAPCCGEALHERRRGIQLKAPGRMP